MHPILGHFIICQNCLSVPMRLLFSGSDLQPFSLSRKSDTVYTIDLFSCSPERRQ